MRTKPRKPSLKAETIKGVLTEGALNMGCWGDPRAAMRGTINCKTPGCLAYHIVAAAKRLGLPVMSGVEARKMLGATNHPDYDAVPVIARDAWARQYGKKAASRLDFYCQESLHPAKFGLQFWKMSEIPATAVVDHIRGKI